MRRALYTPHIVPRHLGVSSLSQPASDRLHGTLDALILRTLTWGPRHGYAIIRWLREQSSDAIQVEEGSLYPALYRLERRGWIEAEWGVSEQGRKARFYTLTTLGRRQLSAEVARFRVFVAAVSPILLS
jgi:PadR family transcriptional regulator, regulatory protein PadR